MAAEPFYADGVVIVVDDDNWHAPREATLRFAEDSRFDWTLVLDQRTASAEPPDTLERSDGVAGGYGRYASAPNPDLDPLTDLAGDHGSAGRR